MALKTTVLISAAFLGIKTAAFAVPIASGSSINLNGYLQANGGTTLSSATSLDFTNGTSASVGTPGLITSFSQGTGVFAGLSCLSNPTGCGSIKDIATLAIGAQTISSFLTLQNGSSSPITFSLSSITSINRDQPQFLTFIANGTITYAGYDATPGQFLFSAQGNQITSFSGTTLTTTAVPEPASLALLGASLAGVGMLRLRKRA